MATTLIFALCSKKAQLKIQQMAFVLVALMIFFGLVALFYFSIWISGIEKSAVERTEQEAFQIALSITGSPEFIFTSSSDCSSCIDLEKAASLDKDKYKNLWNLDYLEIERVYPIPPNKDECTPSNYPNCGKLTIISDSTKNIGSTSRVFVSLVRRENGKFVYEMGKIKVSGKLPNE